MILEKTRTTGSYLHQEMKLHPFFDSETRVKPKILDHYLHLVRRARFRSNLQNYGPRHTFIDDLHPREVQHLLEIETRRNIATHPNNHLLGVANGMAIIHGEGQLIIRNTNGFISFEDLHGNSVAIDCEKNYLPPSVSLFMYIHYILTNEGRYHSIATANPLKKMRGLYSKEEQYHGVSLQAQYAVDPKKSVLFEGLAEPTRIVLSPDFSNDLTKHFLRACFALSQLEVELPGSLERGFQLLEIKTPNISRERLLVTMLQALYDYDSLEDEHFKPLVAFLKQKIWADIKAKGVDLHAYAEDFPYSIFDFSSFWFNDSQLSFEGMEGHRDTQPSEDAESQPLEPISFPSLETRDRHLIHLDRVNGKLRRLSNTNIVRRSMTGKKDQDETISPRKLTELKRQEAQLTREQARKIRQLGEQNQQFQRTLIRVAEEEGAPQTTNPDSMGTTLRTLSRLLITHYQTNHDLQHQLRSQLGNIDNEDLAGDYYHVPLERLQQHPLFMSLVSLAHTEQGRERLRSLSTNQAQEMVIMLRLVVQEFIATTFSRNPNPSFTQLRSSEISQAEKKVMQDIIEQICQASETIPSELEALARVVDKRREVEELLKPDVFKKRVEKLKDWHTQKFLRFFHLSYHFWSFPVERGKRWIETGTYVGAVLAALFGFLVGIGEIAGFDDSEPATENRSEPSKNLTFEEMNGIAPLIDNLPPEEIKKLPIRQFGVVHHLPDFMRQSSSLGFTPLNMYKANGEAYVNEVSRPFNEVATYDTFTSFTPQPNQLVYELDASMLNNLVRRTKTLHPPLDFRIVKVFQEQGDRPNITGDGSLSWLIRYRDPVTKDVTDTHLEVPDRIIIVAEPRNLLHDPLGSQTPTNGVGFYQGRVNPTYYSYFDTDAYQQPRQDFYHNIRETTDTNHSIDQDLYDLYRETDLLLQTVSNSVNRSEEINHIIINQQRKLNTIILNNRYYNLIPNFRDIGDSTPGMEMLERGIENPEAGYYCEVASRITQQFWAKFDIHAPVTIGLNPVIDRSGPQPTLVYRWGHANNSLMLPNGMMGVVDNTPPVTDQTPQEHLDALDFYNYEEDLSWLEMALLTANEYGMKALPPMLLANLLFLAMSLKGTYNHQQAQRKYQRLLALVANHETQVEGSSHLQPIELELITTLTSILVLQPQIDSDSYEGMRYYLDILTNTNFQEWGGVLRWFQEHYSEPTTNVRDLTRPVHVNEAWKKIQPAITDYTSELKSLLPDSVKNQIWELALDGTSTYSFPNKVQPFLEVIKAGVLLARFKHVLASNEPNFTIVQILEQVTQTSDSNKTGQDPRPRYRAIVDQKRQRLLELLAHQVRDLNFEKDARQIDYLVTMTRILTDQKHNTQTAVLRSMIGKKQLTYLNLSDQ